MVTMSPLFEIDNETRANHPNIRTDAMFPPKAVRGARRADRGGCRTAIVDGKPEEVYEPLDHIEPGLPRTLIHVSGSEVLLNDARKAAHMLAAAGVPVEVRVWPGQMHVFQLAAPIVSEATPVAAADRRLHPRGHLVSRSAGLRRWTHAHRPAHQ